MDYKDLTEKEIKVLELADKIKEEHKKNKMEEEKNKKKKKKKKPISEEKKRMKFGKRIMFMAVLICVSMLVFAGVMINMGKDTASLNIMVTAGVSVLPIMFGIYEHNNTKINLKHMEKNYIEDYDEKNNLY